MFDAAQYRLLDFGGGRKLEEFASVVLDRPSPAAAEASPVNPRIWTAAHARYERTHSDRGRWQILKPIPADWGLEHGSLKIEPMLTEFGHVGLFPEQAENWQWLAAQVQAAARPL